MFLCLNLEKLILTTLVKSKVHFFSHFSSSSSLISSNMRNKLDIVVWDFQKNLMKRYKYLLFSCKKTRPIFFVKRGTFQKGKSSPNTFIYIIPTRNSRTIWLFHMYFSACLVFVKILSLFGDHRLWWGTRTPGVPARGSKPGQPADTSGLNQDTYMSKNRTKY